MERINKLLSNKIVEKYQDDYMMIDTPMPPDERTPLKETGRLGQPPLYLKGTFSLAFQVTATSGIVSQERMRIETIHTPVGPGDYLTQVAVPTTTGSTIGTNAVNLSSDVFYTDFIQNGIKIIFSRTDSLTPSFNDFLLSPADNRTMIVSFVKAILAPQTGSFDYRSSQAVSMTPRTGISGKGFSFRILVRYNPGTTTSEFTYSMSIFARQIAYANPSMPSGYVDRLQFTSGGIAFNQVDFPFTVFTLSQFVNPQSMITTTPFGHFFKALQNGVETTQTIFQTQYQSDPDNWHSLLNALVLGQNNLIYSYQGTNKPTAIANFNVESVLVASNYVDFLEPYRVTNALDPGFQVSFSVTAVNDPSNKRPLPDSALVLGMMFIDPTTHQQFKAYNQQPLFYQLNQSVPIQFSSDSAHRLSEAGLIYLNSRIIRIVHTTQMNFVTFWKNFNLSNWITSADITAAKAGQPIIHQIAVQNEFGSVQYTFRATWLVAPPPPPQQEVKKTDYYVQEQAAIEEGQYGMQRFLKSIEEEKNEQVYNLVENALRKDNDAYIRKEDGVFAPRDSYLFRMGAAVGGDEKILVRKALREHGYKGSVDEGMYRYAMHREKLQKQGVVTKNEMLFPTLDDFEKGVYLGGVELIPINKKIFDSYYAHESIDLDNLNMFVYDVPMSSYIPTEPETGIVLYRPSVNAPSIPMTLEQTIPYGAIIQPPFDYKPFSFPKYKVTLDRFSGIPQYINDLHEYRQRRVVTRSQSAILAQNVQNQEPVSSKYRYKYPTKQNEILPPQTFDEYDEDWQDDGTVLEPVRSWEEPPDAWRYADKFYTNVLDQYNRLYDRMYKMYYDSYTQDLPYLADLAYNAGMQSTNALQMGIRGGNKLGSGLLKGFDVANDFFIDNSIIVGKAILDGSILLSKAIIDGSQMGIQYIKDALDDPLQRQVALYPWTMDINRWPAPVYERFTLKTPQIDSPFTNDEQTYFPSSISISPFKHKVQPYFLTFQPFQVQESTDPLITSMYKPKESIFSTALALAQNYVLPVAMASALTFSAYGSWNNLPSQYKPHFSSLIPFFLDTITQKRERGELPRGASGQ